MSRFLDGRYADLREYVPGEQPRAGRFVKLNTNELPYPPSPRAIKAAAAELERLNLYPDPRADAVAVPLAGALCVERGNIFLGNGSDEILAFIFQALCPRGAAFADVTYGFYPVYAALYGVQAEIVPLREDFSLRAEDYFGLRKTVFIANPNAPTGLALPRDDIEAVLRENPHSLVVVDEAYVDFGAQSAVPLIGRYDNLMVVGTFSKSRGMAGARLGYAVACAELIRDMERIKFSFNPYNINRVTLAAGAGCLADSEYFGTCRRRVMETRERAARRFAELGFTASASLANFLFVTHARIPAKTLYECLRERGVLVRWFDGARTQNHLRVSVGTDAEMDVLFAALSEILDAENVRGD